MAQHVPDAGSYAPVTILIDERSDGVHLSYDRMTSFLAPYRNAAALNVARELDHRGFQLVAIRDLMDRGWGRPSQMVEGTGPGGAIPFSVILPCAISNDDD
jgi:hypothetical protein